jgi:hypothetical protein
MSKALKSCQKLSKAVKKNRTIKNKNLIFVCKTALLSEDISQAVDFENNNIFFQLQIFLMFSSHLLIKILKVFPDVWIPCFLDKTL